MKETSVTDRLTFLAKTFDVFDCSTSEALNEKVDLLKAEGYHTFQFMDKRFGQKLNPMELNDPKDIIGIISSKLKEGEKTKITEKISISSDVFANMIAADPTENQMYLQWMLNLFSRLVKEWRPEFKEATYATAIRLVVEDLPQANTYLTLFENNKRKKKFKELCKGSYTLLGVNDPTDINQYKSLSQLFDAVDPFIEKEPSAVERTLHKFVELGQAIIPVKDRRFTLYIPKTTEASVVFDNYANWCTAKSGNGMFKSYTENYKKPNGKNSDIYIIVDNKFFTNESNEMFQLHFETDQLKDRQNGSNIDFFERVLIESDGLRNFFKEELLNLAKQKKGIENNKYLEYLLKFGFPECLFEMLTPETPSMKIMRKNITKLPDITRFTKLKQVVIVESKLSEIHPSIGSLTQLTMLSVPKNKLTTLPKEIGNLKKLNFLNISDNPITEIPAEIAYLDRSNGGNLARIALNLENIGEKVLKRIKELLPTTEIG